MSDVLSSDYTPRTQRHDSADQEKRAAACEANGCHRYVIDQLPVKQNGRHTSDHYTAPPSDCGKSRHVRSRSGRHQHELPLVAELQNEQTQK